MAKIAWVVGGGAALLVGWGLWKARAASAATPPSDQFVPQTPAGQDLLTQMDQSDMDRMVRHGINPDACAARGDGTYGCEQADGTTWVFTPAEERAALQERRALWWNLWNCQPMGELRECIHKEDLCRFGEIPRLPYIADPAANAVARTMVAHALSAPAVRKQRNACDVELGRLRELPQFTEEEQAAQRAEMEAAAREAEERARRLEGMTYAEKVRAEINALTQGKCTWWWSESQCRNAKTQWALLLLSPSQKRRLDGLYSSMSSEERRLRWERMGDAMRWGAHTARSGYLLPKSGGWRTRVRRGKDRLRDLTFRIDWADDMFKDFAVYLSKSRAYNDRSKSERVWGWFDFVDSWVKPSTTRVYYLDPTVDLVIGGLA